MDARWLLADASVVAYARLGAASVSVDSQTVASGTKMNQIEAAAKLRAIVIKAKQDRLLICKHTDLGHMEARIEAWKQYDETVTKAHLEYLDAIAEK